jgi:hypothetical protein
MLADASISRADVSKAKPQRGLPGHRGTRTQAGGSTGVPASGGISGSGATYRLQELSRRGGGSRAATEEKGREPPLRRIRARRASHRGDAPRR